MVVATEQNGRMHAASFAAYLAGLDEEALARLLAARPDACVEPVPRGFAQLAQRLCGPDSIVTALRGMSQDALVVGQAIAFLGESATVSAVARFLGAPEAAVRIEVTALCGTGLSWADSEALYLPDRLSEHWLAEVGGGRPVVKIAAAVPVEDLRATASALGVAVDGLRKPELIARLAEAMADPRMLTEAINTLPAPARTRLDELCQGRFGIMFGFSDPRRRADPTDVLVDAGLVLRPNRRPEVPREVAVAAWLAEHGAGLTGRPEIPLAGAPAAAMRHAAQAAAREAIRALSTLLDEAARSPVAALKKGGVGIRERGRLAKRLSIPDDLLGLWIDIAYEAGLLGEVDGGYAPTDAYTDWRAAEPAGQWAVSATAWYRLQHAPLMREIDDDGRELPPPLPLLSEAGAMRRAMLREARGGWSVAGVGAQIDWFFPLHGYPERVRDEKIAAAVREAELLGVAAGDRVSELGDELLAALGAGGDVVAETARRCAPLLPEAECVVILQSDLTAVVSGQPSVAVSRLLAAAAINESRGDASVWRFNPASIRAALDTGWTAPDLLDQLAAITDRPVPQPVEYLINDAARRHGHIRVRETRSCVVADKALIIEIRNTRSLAKLRLTQVAPTVLASPFELEYVLERLRAAGLSPVAEESSGTTLVEKDQEHRAEGGPGHAERRRTRIPASALARQLTNDPNGDHATPVSGTVDVLAQLNPRLGEAELMLLSHAVDNRDDILIAYRDKNGSHTVRQIRPNQVFGRWLDSFCYLRGADREFTVANIESVAPAR